MVSFFSRKTTFRRVFVNNSVFNLHFMKISTEIDNNFGYEKITQLVDNIPLTRLVIGTSRTVGSAKKFVRITSGFGGGDFTKTLRKVCTCQKLKFSFLLLEYCKIRECYAVANAFTTRNMYSLFL